ncbi:tRNA (adenosine(37)-N6)-threonylcarbamoyltransferase complex transferase subunit TsaD [Buchnera aphidicola (Aphis nasturtii)]|uniref:tRNA (adenosine(37)-N6)-threonylcarbamoyltransferase complex transferase subunit TsaD n=1 Tax=Buchnera aphidicola TaxID=9 RepID=UPI0010C468FC|nr:tRNA (adenosine(37)-N6)-threonylcarbamoyltransferase complex transferase subunit TsaD [Buchnera aphidicola]QCI18053.1 tRNA (adenosine(37)-N6)-threonylcarbamoyltransferase complex transferase subunit TsaD [Buchnera aphidicola (Aphis nasturtii)]
MKVLGIETSCDDTGLAVYDNAQGLLINELYNQKKIHANYGGIIPELASREHSKKIIFLIDKIFKKINMKKDINLIAYTAGPGLVGSLLVGATFACSLGFALNIPVLPINHMEAHLLSPMLECKSITFPFIGLLVSGKHTQIIAAYKLGKYEILGNSLDDAAGEAFDKISKLLNLKYPNGRELSNLAEKGIKMNLQFPRPMKNHSNLNFSFSGLKTFTADMIKNKNLNFQQKANVAKAFEDAVIDILLIKTQKALRQKKWSNLVIAGGVSANKLLRKKSEVMMRKVFNGKVFYASSKFCTDNGAMIAYLGSLYYNKKNFSSSLEILVKPKWSLDNLSVL